MKNLESIRTEHLSLRCWQAADAPALKDAIDSSLESLRAWLPWALEEPTPLEAMGSRLEGFRRDFFAGRDWLFGIFDAAGQAVLGSCGLHARRGPGTLEVGYWLRDSAKGKGHATEAVAAVVEAAFTVWRVDRVEIRCDPHNLRSAAVPRRLGFRHLKTLSSDARTPAGTPRDTMIWELRRFRDELSAPGTE